MESENLIVGIETSDDAAVYKLNDEMAVIQTLDFFTPVVDDPYTFGQIAAANSLSDVYAMGGKPTVALNIVCFPTCISIDILGEILRGGADKVLESGAVVVGGHTVEDSEPKYGLSVMGLVHPDKILKNYGSKEGDVVIITKPLGIGIINTAIKGEVASKEAYNKAVKVMSTLNKYAGEIVAKYNLSACTDITGFGIMGHAYEMASASKVSLKIYSDRIPYIEEAKEYAEMGLVPAGSYNNRNYIDGKYELKNIPEWMKDILFDPQTSGGLLITCSKEEGEKIMKELLTLEMPSAVIGEVIEQQGENYIIVE
ncbi:segregation protein B [Clostridium carboxidivorans P7]|uniref:Selenide, water dikinase n=2 Tax=Clostridium TaxID=1485 RepID=C6Q1X0_9CLOT|nr:segregation protein B [Clostridium carboxidivorans P7]EET84508.1 selenide, water dikinase [Clostridium carboxidivorans P7]